MAGVRGPEPVTWVAGMGSVHNDLPKVSDDAACAVV